MLRVNNMSGFGSGKYEHKVNLNNISWVRNYDTLRDTLRGLFFEPDGSSFFVASNTTDDIHQFGMTTPYDISTSSESDNLPMADIPEGISFKPDGTKIFVGRLDGSIRRVYQNTFSTAWDMTSAGSWSNVDVSSQVTTMRQTSFSTDGTVLYIADGGVDIEKYTLSTAWDVTSATWSSNTNISGGGMILNNFWMSLDGTQVVGHTNGSNTLYAGECTTPFDLTTVVFRHSKSVTGLSGNQNIRGVWVSEDYKKLYTCGWTPVKSVSEYDL